MLILNGIPFGFDRFEQGAGVLQFLVAEAFIEQNNRIGFL